MAYKKRFKEKYRKRSYSVHTRAGNLVRRFLPRGANDRTNSGL